MCNLACMSQFTTGTQMNLISFLAVVIIYGSTLLFLMKGDRKYFLGYCHRKASHCRPFCLKRINENGQSGSARGANHLKVQGEVGKFRCYHCWKLWIPGHTGQPWRIFVENFHFGDGAVSTTNPKYPEHDIPKQDDASTLEQFFEYLTMIVLFPRGQGYQWAVITHRRWDLEGKLIRHQK